MSITKKIFAYALATVLALSSVVLAGCSSKTCEHDLTRIAPKAATCSENGNREYYECSKCKTCFADKDGTILLAKEKYEIKAFGHTLMKHDEKQATCLLAGVSEYYECRNCHKLYSDDKGTEISSPVEKPKFDHKYTKVSAKETTEFDYGWQEHYECLYCGTLASDKDGKNQITLESITIAPTNTDFDYKIAFTPATGWEGGGAAHISAEYTTADGLPATQFTFAAGGKKNDEVEAWLIHEADTTKSQGIDIRIPTFNGKTKQIELVVKNDGGQEVSFYYYAENNGDKGGVTVTVGVGEKKTVTFRVNPGDTIGCNYALKLLSDVTTETKVTMYGYFDCTDEIESISLLKQATKKTFKVGDKFTAKGLVVKANGNNYKDVVIANYTIGIEEGYVFTSADIGTKTVMVKFGKYNVTYDITITE